MSVLISTLVFKLIAHFFLTGLLIELLGSNPSNTRHQLNSLIPCLLAVDPQSLQNRLPTPCPNSQSCQLPAVWSQCSGTSLLSAITCLAAAKSLLSSFSLWLPAIFPVMQLAKQICKQFCGHLFCLFPCVLLSHLPKYNKLKVTIRREQSFL